MSEIGLILTADYEVWGDGSGCVQKCVIEPADRMMKIAEKHNARITFFFDVCEYWVFEKIELEGGFKSEYKPATWMKNQLQEAIKNGHDVQLHFHPQWLNYKKITDFKWQLDNRYWRLPEVEKYYNGNWTIEKLFIEGVKTLETMFKPIKSDYKVTSFRAGAWCIQPEELVVSAMKKVNIEIDSTVAPGIKNIEHPNYFDFEYALKKPYWNIGTKVTEKGNSNLIEIPISTSIINLPERVQHILLKIGSKELIKPQGCHNNLKNGQNIFKSISNLLFQKTKMLNFSDGTSFLELKRITTKEMKKKGHSENNFIPLVAISHPKTFGLFNALEEYLSWVDLTGNISYLTMSEMAQKLKS